MQQEFTTSFEYRRHDFSSYFDEQIKERLRQLRSDPLSPAAKSLASYGSAPMSGLRWGNGAGYARILSPAGAWLVHPLSSDGDDPQVIVLSRQVEISRHGLPDLFESLLWVEGNHQSGNFISVAVPVMSPGEGIRFFDQALKGKHANELTAVLGDTLPARLFGLAATPVALKYELNRPIPSRADLLRTSRELKTAFASLGEVMERLSDTDALGYMERRISHLRRLLMLASGEPLNEMLQDISEIEQKFSSLADKSGRPPKAGREHMVAKTLARLWEACGLGQPKLSAQARFIRACTVVLPWHNVHKADVRQFMKAELAKKVMAGVLIG